MTKHKHAHDVGRGKKVLQHGSVQAIGPLANPRHPKKFKLEPLDKKTAPSAANTEDGRADQRSNKLN